MVSPEIVTISRDELKQLIKEAVREVLSEIAPPQERDRPAMLTLEQIAAIKKQHIVTVRNQARLGLIAGAKKTGRKYLVVTSKFEKHLGFAPGTMPIR